MKALLSLTKMALCLVVLMSFGREAMAVNVAPTVATPASASPNPVTGTTTTLSVLGADDAGEPALIYTWSTTGTPPASVAFSVNGTNAAKTSVATFTKAGSYTLRATIRDAGALTVTSDVVVTVSQTSTSLAVAPSSSSIPQRGALALTGDLRDQFGSSVLAQPLLSWTTSGGGTLLPTGSVLIEASGSDIWNTSDGFRFAHQTLTGDGTITAKVDSLVNTDAWSKAGVMIRDGLGANAVNAMANVTAAAGALFQRRTTVGGVSVNTIVAGQAAPKWVRLQRVGNTLTGSYSSDGTTWTVIASDTVTMAPTVYIGLAVTAHNTSRKTQAAFSNVTVTTPSATAIAPPSPWVAQDIGTVGLAGSSTYTPSTKLFTVTGAGADIWGAADAFRFVHQPVTGDATVIARVTGVQNTDAWAKGGVMIRDGLSPDARNVLVDLTPVSGVVIQRRVAVAGTTVSTVTSGQLPPKWVKLVRSGNLFSGYYSTDGLSWTFIGSDTVTMGATVNVGLAVTAHTAAALCTATFDNVTIVQGSGPLAIPVSPWRHQDIGTTVPAGSTRQVMAPGVFLANGATGGPFTLTATGGGRSGTAAVTVVNAAPTVVVAAAATPNPVTGTTTALSVIGGDDLGEEGLTYTWSTTGTPPASVAFSATGTNAAKNVTATFTRAGSYTLRATIRDAGTLTATSDVVVTVSQTYTSVAVAPASASVIVGKTQTYTATARDQFAQALTTQPTFTWTTSGGGTIAATGVFTAGTTTGGPFTITATSGARSGTATATVINAAPTVATAAASAPNPVTGTTANLSVLGADDGSEPSLTYAWSTTGTPPASVAFSATGTNAAKNVTATFTRAGSYTLRATIRDAGNLTATSDVVVTVSQTYTSVAVAPASVSVSTGGTQTFTATARDQFAQALTTQPTFTWATSGGGTIAATGVFTAGGAAGGPFTITATSGARSGTAAVTVTGGNTPPTVVTAASASPNPVTGTTTTLSVLGADNGGEPALIYTWSTTGTPPASVAFSVNGTNAAKTSVATFTKAGSYTLRATIRDAGALTVTSDVVVTVSQTSTSLAVAPSSSSIPQRGALALTGDLRDQFGSSVLAQPLLSWTTSGGGTLLPTGSVLIEASGSDIWNTSDGFRFAHQTLTGDGTITAKVDSLVNTDAWSKAGVMIRDGLGANAVNAMANVTAAAGALFQRRTTVGGVSVNTIVAGQAAPKWVRLQRVGNTLTGSYSSDGTTWTVIASDTVTMAPTVYIGLAVTAHNTSRKTQAAFSNVTVTTPSATAIAPPSPWVAQDIGTVGLAGSSTYTPSTKLFTVTGAGADIWGAADAFRFVHQPVTGDATVIARVTGVQNTDAWAKGGVMIRDGLSPDARNVLVDLTPVSGVVIQRRVAVAGTTVSTVTSGQLPPKWVKLVRSGNLFSGYYSTDGLSWTFIGSDTVTMGATVNVGLAVTAHTAAALCTATFDNVTIVQGSGPLAIPVSPWRHQDIGTTVPAGSTRQVMAPGVFLANGATGGPFTLTATGGGRSGTAAVTVVNAAPTVVVAAAATPNPVTGTTTALSVIGGDDLGEEGLTYTWSTTGTPPASVAFSATGTNAAKNVTATFTRAGSYTLRATIRDAGTLTATSDVVVTVNQTLTTVVVAPASASVATGGTQTFTATGRDQFAQTLTTQPTFTWTTSGGGTIAATGVFTAGGTAGGPFTITATSGARSGTAAVTVTGGGNTPPTFVSGPTATPNPVPGTTTALSMLGTDNGGEAALVYAWSTVGTPPASVTFSANNSNAAKNATATFTRAGSYTIRGTITDAGALFITADVVVTVNQTYTSVVVAPTSASVIVGKTQTYTATARDQFAQALTTQPTFTWTTSGGGTIAATGVFTAGTTTGGPFTITATSGARNGTATATVINAAPTVATAAASTPNPVTSTTANLSVLGADDGGEPSLTYVWSTVGTPPAPVSFSATGTNAAKNVTATFTMAGSYTLRATIRDVGTLTATSDVAVTVTATLTTIAVTPATVTVPAGTAQAFSASGRDQFGTALASQPSFAWSATGSPTIVGSSFTWATPGTYTVTAASGGRTGTSTVTVTASGAPTIAITSPATNTVINAPGPVPFTVTAADSNGTVTKVDYFQGSILIGTSTTSPFSFTWTNVPAATYTITAVATDNASLSTPSAPITVIVNGAPSVTLTSPTNGATFAPAGTISLAATAVDADGSIAQVQFFNGATSLNIDTSSPFSYSWTGVAAGVYSLTAVATDNRGRTATSPAVTVLVQGASPTVAMPAAASPNPVTGTITTVTALGQDDGGEPALKYTWTSSPSAGVVFLPNGTHASQVSVVSFPNAGSYTLTCTIADAQSNTVTTATTVTVQHVATTVVVTPSTASVTLGQSQLFSASVVNQFGAPVSPQPTLTWSLPSPAGVLSATTGASVTMYANNLVGGPHQMTVTGASLTQPVFVTVQPFASAGGGGSPDDAGVDSVQLHVGQKGPYSYDPGTHPDGYPHNYIQLNWTRESMDGVGVAGFILPGDSPANCFYRPDLQYDATGPEGSCEVAQAWVIGERPGKVKIRRVAIGNTNRDTSKSGNPVYDCNQSTGGPVRQSNNPVTRETIVTVLPNGKPQKTPLGSKYARVDSHGVPMPDASPTGEGEQDRIPNSAYTDMYALAPTYSVTDVAQPIEGGELVMEFRRTVSIGRRGYFIDHKQRSIAYPTEDLMGAGWDVNIGSRLVIGQSQDANGIYQQDAVVTDETGGSAQYSYNATTGVFSPDVAHSFNNASLKSSLKKVGLTYIYKKAHGTTLVFEQLPASGSVPADRSFMPPATEASECSATVPRIEHYYRLKSISDRNGNKILLTYKTLNPTFSKLLHNQPPTGSGPDGDTLVDTMYEEAHPERRITFTYVNLGFEGPGLDTGWRIQTVTDSLSRVITYNYYPTAPWNTNMDPNSQPLAHANYANQRCLSSVVRPTVESGTPTVTFDYTRFQLADQTLDPLAQASTLSLVPEIRYIAPKTITDARGHATTFNYAKEWFPSATYADFGGGVVWEQKIRVDAIGTVDGTARFSTTQRTASQVTTKVTDTRGTTTTYTFGATLISVPSITGRAMVVTNQTRATLMSDSTIKTATFTYSGDLCNNLTQVTDLSGNIIQYSYVNSHTDAATDDFNKGIYNAGAAINPNSNPNGYQAYGKPCTRIVDPGTAPKLNLVTRYRHKTGLDANGQPLYTKEVKTIDAEGIVTRYTLDTKGNRLTVVEGETEAGVTPVTRTTTYEYETNGFVKKVTDAESRVTEFAQSFTPASLNAYRTQTTTVKGFVPAGPVLNYVTTEVFDRLGNRRSATDARLKRTDFDYDNLNRPISETRPAVINALGASTQSTSEMHYDSNGNVIWTKDHEGNRTSTTYDGMNRATMVRRRMNDPAADHASDLISHATYDKVGLMASSVDANGNTTSFTYDNLMRMVTKTYPAIIEPGTTTFVRYTEQFTYGANAGSGAFTHWSGWQPTRVLDRNGNATDATYDAIYRRTRVIQRLNPATASISAPLAGEPAVETKYNFVHKVVQTTTWNETLGGADAKQRSYTVYDMLYRPTVAITDMDTTDGVTLTGTTTVAGITGGAKFMNFATQDAVFTAFSTDASALVSCTKYNSVDKPTFTFVKDPLGNNVTRTIYDGAGRPVEVIQPPVAIVDPANYNTSPVTPTTKTTYDPVGNKIEVEDANHTKAQFLYDDRNRVIRTIVDLNGNGTFDPTLGVTGTDIVSLTRYNLENKPVKVTDSRGSETDTAYDRAYRVTQVQQPLVADAENGAAMTRPTILTVYDANGNVVQMTDPRGVSTASIYDTLNRVTAITHAYGTADAMTTETRYDCNNNVMSLILYNSATSGGVQTTSYLYDALNRKTRETLPSSDGASRVTDFTYYRTGAMKRVTDPKGQFKEAIAYDLAGRLLTQEYRRANTTLEETRGFAYDSVGRMTNVTDVAGSSTLTYDLLSRLLSEARSTTGQAAYTVQNAYDAAGNNTRVIYPPGASATRTILRTIDRAGRLKVVADGGKSTTYGYDQNGNPLTSTDNLTGVVTTQSFDALNRATSSSTMKGATTIAAYTYTFDRVGNRKVVFENLPGQTPATRTTTYGYDAQYRLVSEAWAGYSNAYVYDPAGNRTRQTNVNGATTTITDSTYDSLNRLRTSVTGGVTTTYQYDLTGNQTGQITGGTVTAAMTWDVSSRLVSLTSGGATCTSTYDYRTRRQTKAVGGTTTFFRYHGGVSFQELQSGVVQVEFVRGNDMGGGIGSVLYGDRAGVLEHFAYNPSVGHVAALSNASGVATDTNRFDAFGWRVSKTGSSVNNRLANTKERDVVGSSSFTLDAHGFRFYNPLTGRYISRDPIGYGDGPNVYLYVKNNPINRIDPLGLAEWHHRVGKSAFFEALHKHPELWEGGKVGKVDMKTFKVTEGKLLLDPNSKEFGIFLHKDNHSQVAGQHGDWQRWWKTMDGQVVTPEKIKAAMGEMEGKAKYAPHLENGVAADRSYHQWKSTTDTDDDARASIRARVQERRQEVADRQVKGSRQLAIAFMLLDLGKKAEAGGSLTAQELRERLKNWAGKVVNNGDAAEEKVKVLETLEKAGMHNQVGLGNAFKELWKAGENYNAETPRVPE